MGSSKEKINIIDTNRKNLNLYTMYGIGFDLFGKYAPKSLDGLSFKLYFFCFVFIPIFPLGIYLVKVSNSEPIGDYLNDDDLGTSYLIYGKIRLINLIRYYGFNALLTLIITTLINMIGKMIAFAVYIGLVILVVYIMRWVFY